MIILAIGSAARPVSIALFKDNKLLGLRLGAWPGEELMPQIQSLVKDEHLSLRKINVFAAVHGPGAFTCLRIGLTTAKTLAQITGQRLVTVDALEATAAQLVPHDATVVVTQKACRDEYNVALFGATPLRRLTPNAVATQAVLLALLGDTNGQPVLAGDGAQELHQLLVKTHKRTQVRLALGADGMLTANGVGLVAYRHAKQKIFADPLQAAPVYSHSPNIIFSQRINYEKLAAAPR